MARPNDAWFLVVGILADTCAMLAGCGGEVMLGVEPDADVPSQHLTRENDGAAPDTDAEAAHTDGPSLAPPIGSDASVRGCALDGPENGSLGTCPSVLPAGDECQFACDVGYNLTGTGTTCTGATLTAQTCTSTTSFGPCSVTAPSNGSLGTCSSVLGAGVECQFACNAGYTLAGSGTTCDGTTLTAQTCQVNSSSTTCALAPPMNGNFGTCSSVLGAGVECQFACNAGYTLAGSGTTCDGTTLTVQTCQAAGSSSECALAAPVNGSLGTCPSVLPASSACQLACDAGYNLTGASTTCDGTTLTAQTCTMGFGACSVAAPSNGTLGTCSPVLGPGEECQFACDAGYNLTGAGTTCDGTTLTAQTCTMGFGACSVTAPSNGTLGNCPSVLPPGTECNFACHAGYTLTGVGTTCTGMTLIAQTCVP
jgi:hypothetical protein